jgi:hypothetical protein
MYLPETVTDYSSAREKQEERARRDEEKRVQREEASAAKEKRQTEAAAEKEKARLEREEKRKSQGKKPGFFSGTFGRSAGAAAAGTAAVGGAGIAATSATATDTAAPAVMETASPIHATEEGITQEAKIDPEPERPMTPASAESAKSPVADREGTMPVVDTAEPEPVAAVPATTRAADETLVSPSKRDSRIKSFFGRFRGKSQSVDDENQDVFKDSPQHTSDIKKSTEIDTSGTGGITRSDSMRDVALAGRATRDSEETDDMYGDATEHQAPDSPVSPVKETYHDKTTIPPASSETTPATITRDRSPSISSLSSSDDERPAPAAVSSPTDSTSPITEGRGRQGLRQRLLKKVKPSSTSDSSGGVSIPGKSKLSKNRGKPATAADADESEKAADPPLTEVAGEGITAEAAAEVTPASGTVGGPAAGKKSQDTQEREEARDDFKEEVSLAPPPKLADAARGESPRGSRERSRFHEEL